MVTDSTSILHSSHSRFHGLTGVQYKIIIDDRNHPLQLAKNVVEVLDITSFWHEQWTDNASKTWKSLIMMGTTSLYFKNNHILLTPCKTFFSTSGYELKTSMSSIICNLLDSYCTVKRTSWAFSAMPHLCGCGKQHRNFFKVVKRIIIYYGKEEDTWSVVSLFHCCFINMKV